MKIKFMFILFIVVYSSASYSLDCTRPIKRVWAGNDDNRIYVIHNDSSANSAMSLVSANNDEKVIDRALSILLTAKVSGNQVTFRYIRTNGVAATCIPTQTQQFIGVWLD